MTNGRLNVRLARKTGCCRVGIASAESIRARDDFADLMGRAPGHTGAIPSKSSHQKARVLVSRRQLLDDCAAVSPGAGLSFFA
jgi:hypothetical protein